MSTEATDRARRIAAARAADVAAHNQQCRTNAEAASIRGHQDAVVAEAMAAADLAQWALAQRRAAEAAEQQH